MTKHVFFSVTNTTRTFGHISCTNFEYFWNKRRESVCACVNRREISEFLCRGFPGTKKTTENGHFRGGVCDRGTAQTAQFPAVGIISGTSRHREWVLVGDYGLGAISPRKQQISAIAVVDVLLSHDAEVNKPMWAWHAVRRCVSKRHSQGGSTLSSSLYCSASPDTLQPV